MKQICHSAIISLFLLLLISNTSARPIPSHQGDNPRTKPDKITQQEADFSSLTGLEESCGDRDEDCERRRMVAEAHLDYIYTQHHHP